MASRPRIAAFVATVALAAGAVVSTHIAPASAQNRQVSIAVPAYFDDDALWDRAIGASQVSYIIGHPATPVNGKYTTNPALAAHLADAKKAGKTTLVYVTAGYEKVTWQTLGDQIESAIAAYPQADGVFLDEIGYNQCDKFGSLTKGAGALKGIKSRIANKLVVLNPGAPIVTCFEGYGDGFVNLERADAKIGEWITNVNEPGNVPFYSWMFKAENRPRIWQMIHDVPTARISDAVDAALTRNASVLFLTNDKLPNPYDSLPDADTWKALLDRVDAYNSGKIALPAVIKLKEPVAAPTPTTKPAAKPKKKKKK